jgi:endonuclease/exonuclease/phosphatase (EEP) superfamily protein YafD
MRRGPVVEADIVPDEHRRRASGDRRSRAGRRVCRALSVLLLVWLLYFQVFEVVVPKIQVGESHQLLLPVMFFVAPLVLLALPVLLAARRSVPLPSRLLLGLTSAWLTFMVLHRLLTGTTWLWVPFNLMPPLAAVLVPSALLLAVPWAALCGVPVTRFAARWTAVLAIVATGVAADHSGVVLSALWTGPDQPGHGNQLRVVSWDTYDWETGDGERLHRFIASQEADVYLFQDHIGGSSEQPRPADDTERLRARFPGYHLAASGELLIVSRLPIVAQKVLDTGRAQPPGAPGEAWPEFWGHRVLRTDLQVGKDIVSVYNVHLFDLFYATMSPLDPDFYSAIRGLDARRSTQLAALHDEISRNRHPVVLSGNFNQLSNMDELPWSERLRDASDVNRSLYPTSLNFFGATLWRVDWTFVSPDIRVQRYELRDQEELSPHKVQYLHMSLPE